MKDYSLTRDEEKNFILSYKIKNDKIIIKMANGKKKFALYTKDNEKFIIEYMMKQLANSGEFIKWQFREMKKWGRIFWIAWICLNIKMFMFIGTTIRDLVILFGLLGIETISIISQLISRNNIEDIKKNLDFVCNEKIINDSVRDNDKTLDGVSKKTRKIVESTLLDKASLNINTIDEVSYNDLKKVMDNIGIDGIYKGNVKRRVRKR